MQGALDPLVDAFELFYVELFVADQIDRATSALQSLVYVGVTAAQSSSLLFG